jgi:hypothetical protein
MRGMREGEKKGARNVIKYARGVLVTCVNECCRRAKQPQVGRIKNYIYVWVTARSKRRKREWDDSGIRDAE